MSFLLLMVAIPDGLFAIILAFMRDRTAAAGVHIMLMIYAPIWISLAALLSIIPGVMIARLMKRLEPAKSQNDGQFPKPASADSKTSH
jgi:hypothetical protein